MKINRQIQQHDKTFLNRNRHGFVLAETILGLLLLGLVIGGLMPLIFQCSRQHQQLNVAQQRHYALSGVMEQVLVSRQMNQPIDRSDWSKLLPDGLEVDEIDISITPMNTTETGNAELIVLTWTEPATVNSSNRVLKTTILKTLHFPESRPATSVTDSLETETAQ